MYGLERKLYEQEYIEKRGHVYSKAILRKWIIQGESVKVKSIIESVNEADLIDGTGSSFLHLASKHNNCKMVDLLIQLGYKIDLKNRAGETPLVLALRRKNFKCTELLLKANANISIVSPEGLSVIKIYFGLNAVSEEATKLLIQKTRSNSAIDEETVDKLLEAGCRLVHIVQVRDPELTKIYLDRRGTTGVSDGIAVRTAMENHDIENLRVLFFHGDVNQYMVRRSALFSNQYTIVRLIEMNLKTLEFCIEIIRDWKLLNEYTVVSILYLAETEPSKTLQVILKTGINSYLKKDFECNLMVHAFGNRDSKVREWLKTKKINIHSVTKNKQSTLHIAVGNGIVKNVEDLLILGINANVTDKTGRTPIFNLFSSYTNSWERAECFKLLIQHGCDLQICDKNGKTFIEYIKDPKECLGLFEIVLKHLAIMKVQGIPIKIQIENYFRQFAFIDLFEKLLNQLEQMKSQTVCVKVSLFDILISNTESVCCKVCPLNNKKYEKLFDDVQNCEYDPYYIDVLKKRISEAMDINELRKRALNHIGNNIPILKPYYVVLRKIVCFLPYDYLEKFKFVGANGWKTNRNSNTVDSINRNLSRGYSSNYYSLKHK